MKMSNKKLHTPLYPYYIVICHNLLTGSIAEDVIYKMATRANIEVRKIVDVPYEAWDNLGDAKRGFKKGELVVIGTGSSHFSMREVAVYFKTPEDMMRFKLSFTDDEMEQLGKDAQDKKLNDIFDDIKNERTLRKQGVLAKGRQMSREEFQDLHMGKFTNDEE